VRDWLGELPQATASETRKQRAAREREELRAAREAQLLEAERLALAEEGGSEPGMSDLSAPEHMAAGGNIKFFTGDVSKFAIPPASFDAGLRLCCSLCGRICDYSRVSLCARSHGVF